MINAAALDAYLEAPYQEDYQDWEAAEELMSLMDQQTVAMAAGRWNPIEYALDHLTWLLTGDDEPGAAVRRFGRISLEDYKNLAWAKDLDLTDLKNVLADYAYSPY